MANITWTETQVWRTIEWRPYDRRNKSAICEAQVEEYFYNGRELRINVLGQTN